MDDKIKSEPTQSEPQPQPGAEAHPTQRDDDARPAPRSGPGGGRPLTRAEAVVELAQRGHRSVLPQVEQIFDLRPDLWQSAGDLTRLVEQAWLEKICRKDLFAGQAMRRHVEQLKRELAGPSPSPIERLLAERIAACWLAAQCAELAAATGDGAGPKVAQVWAKQAESANRRFLAAVKALAVVRRLAGGLKIEISHTHGEPASAPPGALGRGGAVPPAAGASEAGANTDPGADQNVVAERLRGFLRNGSAGESDLAAALPGS